MFMLATTQTFGSRPKCHAYSKVPRSLVAQRLMRRVPPVRRDVLSRRGIPRCQPICRAGAARACRTRRLAAP